LVLLNHNLITYHESSIHVTQLVLFALEVVPNII
jgi:hypothetical protein